MDDDHLEKPRPGKDSVLPGMPNMGISIELLDQETGGNVSLPLETASGYFEDYIQAVN